MSEEVACVRGAGVSDTALAEIEFPKTETDADYFSAISSDAAYERAEEDGLRIVLPQENELLVDIDCDADLARFHGTLHNFSRLIAQIESTNLTTSKSGDPHKFHAVVKLARPVTPMERILFQAFLGSDVLREMLSYVRLANNDERPTLFFEKAVTP